jgi:putative FmdB family regulatory protein
VPIYEYRCRRCGGASTVVTLRASERVSPRCRSCGSRALERLLSAPARVRSAAARFDAVADPAGVDESDPRAVARWMRDLGSELAPDAGDDFAGVVDDIESGRDRDEDAT